MLIRLQRQYGWRTAKRPGVDYFLAYLSQFYEIVLFTTQYNYVRLSLLLVHSLSNLSQTAAPIVEKLDPYSFHIAYKLFRDATRSDNGRPVKVRYTLLPYPPSTDRSFLGSIISQSRPFKSHHPRH